jgi:hypothetical protein
MRAYTPGGRFDSDFESDAIADGVTADLTNPAGTLAQWWKFDAANSIKDSIYDVEAVGTGRVWIGPKTISVVRASLTQGSSMLNERGFYNVDTLHLTLNVDDVQAVAPEVFTNPGIITSSVDLLDKYRVVYKNQVFRPTKAQPAGLVASRYTLVVMDLSQLAPDELVNDAQFLSYADAGIPVGYGSAQFGINPYGD